jgi:hypothetical protein
MKPGFQIATGAYSSYVTIAIWKGIRSRFHFGMGISLRISLGVVLVWSIAFPFSTLWGIDDIKKINSLDVEKVRDDSSRRIVMEGHGSVLQHLPTVESPFYTQRYAVKTAEKTYEDPWRQPRPKKLSVPIPSGAIAVPKEHIDNDTQRQTKQSKVFLFEDISNSMHPKISDEEEDLIP